MAAESIITEYTETLLMSGVQMYSLAGDNRTRKASTPPEEWLPVAAGGQGKIYKKESRSGRTIVAKVALPSVDHDNFKETFDEINTLHKICRSLNKQNLTHCQRLFPLLYGFEVNLNFGGEGTFMLEGGKGYSPIPGNYVNIFMEHIDGQTLNNFTPAEYTTPLFSGGPTLLSSCMYQLSCALAFIHSMESVHGDIKPDNIMLFRGGNSENRLVLIDYGAVVGINYPKGLGGKNKGNCCLKRMRGTLTYVAPEILIASGAKWPFDLDELNIYLSNKGGEFFQGDTYGTMADWWSMGILILELLINMKVEDHPRYKPFVKRIDRGEVKEKVQGDFSLKHPHLPLNLLEPWEWNESHTIAGDEPGIKVWGDKILDMGQIIDFVSDVDVREYMRRVGLEDWYDAFEKHLPNRMKSVSAVRTTTFKEILDTAKEANVPLPVGGGEQVLSALKKTPTESAVVDEAENIKGVTIFFQQKLDKIISEGLLDEEGKEFILSLLEHDPNKRGYAVIKNQKTQEDIILKWQSGFGIEGTTKANAFFGAGCSEPIDVCAKGFHQCMKEDFHDHLELENRDPDTPYYPQLPPADILKYNILEGWLKKIPTTEHVVQSMRIQTKWVVITSDGMCYLFHCNTISKLPEMTKTEMIRKNRHVMEQAAVGKFGEEISGVTTDGYKVWLTKEKDVIDLNDATEIKLEGDKLIILFRLINKDFLKAARSWMEGVYREKKPEKLKDVDTLLREWGGREEELMTKIKEKYNHNELPPQQEQQEKRTITLELLTGFFGSKTTDDKIYHKLGTWYKKLISVSKLGGSKRLGYPDLEPVLEPEPDLESAPELEPEPEPELQSEPVVEAEAPPETAGQMYPSAATLTDTSMKDPEAGDRIIQLDPVRWSSSDALAVSGADGGAAGGGGAAGAGGSTGEGVGVKVSVQPATGGGKKYTKTKKKKISKKKKTYKKKKNSKKKYKKRKSKKRNTKRRTKKR